ncbi:McrC family protein [Psychrobacter sp. I-STPA6b]|uniref:McrC family protein n=1 Tax=Psychrobacter sp. I-STPA6b TaxID=2585718 RepID=UPI001D0CCF7E|nr:McrC family protein [Psychrobacter sp. I-STPA6b]
MEKMICLEHQILEQKDFAHQQDFEYLLSQDLPCFTLRFYKGMPQLLVRHYLAILRLPSGQYLEILPKITLQDIQQHKRLALEQSARFWIARMLKRIAGRLSMQPLQVTGDYSRLAQKELTETLPPWYVQLYHDFTNLIIKVSQCLPRHYQTQRQNATQIQGKINFKQQIKHNLHRPHYIISEREQLQDNELLWQFLLTGWHCAKTCLYADIPDVMANQYQRLYNTEMSSLFDITNHHLLAVTQYQSAYQALQQQQAGWQNQCNTEQRQFIYRAIEWAWWFLQPRIASADTQGYLPQPAFMLNMPYAFELWVTESLRYQLQTAKSPYKLQAQPSYDWLVMEENMGGIKSQKNCRRIQPDICLIRQKDTEQRNIETEAQNAQITHVIDVKYKSLSHSRQIEASDLYQLQAYQHHLHASQAWLVYPANAQFQTPILLHQLSPSRRRQNMTQTMMIVPFCVQQEKLLIDFLI